MIPLPQVLQVQAQCTNMLDTKTAFLTRIDNGESIFVPSTVAFVSGLAPGDVVTAHIVPNTHQPGRTPWFAIRVDRCAPETLLEIGTTDSRVDMFLSETPAYATASEVADALGVATSAVNGALDRLFRDGRIARADVYSSPQQQQPLFCLWAKEAFRFIDEVDA
tara:strand:+ start:2333 stop:2824 length:492 start_codon:yes stop_codon:yes gene_type:complete